MYIALLIPIMLTSMIPSSLAKHPQHRHFTPLVQNKRSLIGQVRASI